LKDAHLLRCAHLASLRRTKSTPRCLPETSAFGDAFRQKATWHFVPLPSPFRRIQATHCAGGCLIRMIACKQVSETAHALHLSFFEQPAYIDFFKALLELFSLVQIFNI
jgi:hypothetical protein